MGRWKIFFIYCLCHSSIPFCLFRIQSSSFSYFFSSDLSFPYFVSRTARSDIVAADISMMMIMTTKNIMLYYIAAENNRDKDFTQDSFKLQTVGCFKCEMGLVCHINL